MYSKISNLVLGFHGCDISVYDEVISHNQPLKESQNEYDWLGHGIYFWEQNPQRAYEWAEILSKRPNSKIKTPAVIGAVIDLGYCLNLLDSASISVLKRQYELLKKEFELVGKDLPQNRNIGSNKDLLLRNLDCAVIQNLHYDRKTSGVQAFDSIRGLFIEGNQIYLESGFREKTHIQLCICNPNCIKGYFSPMSADKQFPLP